MDKHQLLNTVKEIFILFMRYRKQKCPWRWRRGRFSGAMDIYDRKELTDKFRRERIFLVDNNPKEKVEVKLYG